MNILNIDIISIYRSNLYFSVYKTTHTLPRKNTHIQIYTYIHTYNIST